MSDALVPLRRLRAQVERSLSTSPELEIRFV
jgi:hypothetical protein